MSVWRQVVRRIRNGMPVNEISAGIPVQDLADRTNYLKQVLEAFQAGHALTDQDAALHASTYVGAAVYFSEADNAYVPALASYTVSGDGLVTFDSSSKVLGVVIEKSGTHAGTVVLSGRIKDVDITVATGASPEAGVYYLSDSTPGALVSSPPPLAIPVIYLIDGSNFWVDPAGVKDDFSHKHFSFRLTALPAGEVEESGSSYVFTSTDVDAKGWLPADHASFSGLTVPSGAEFGYNIAADNALSNHWPPIPPESARLFLDGTLQRNEQVEINDDGIWWMSNCPSAVPFEPDPDYDYEHDPDACPPDWMLPSLELFYSAMGGLTKDTIVSQLKASEPLKIVSCATGDPADRGRLLISVDPLEVSGFDSGQPLPSLSLRDVDRTHRYPAPNVSGVRGAGGLQVTGTGPNYVDDEGRVWRTGGIVVDAGGLDAQRQGGIGLVSLDDVSQKNHQGTLYWSFAPSKDTAMRVRLSLPDNVLPSPAELVFSFWVVGEAAGNVPNLGLGYRRISKNASPTVLPTTDTALANLVPAATVSPFTYQVIESAPFAVANGDLVFLNISRDADGGDGYNSNVGIVDIRWEVRSPA